MNERQKSLLNYLLDNNVGEYICKEDICESLKELYPRHLEKSNEHTSGVFTMLSKDVRALNSDDECEYIILSSKAGYRVANGFYEADRYIKRSFARAGKIFKRSWKMTKKVSMNYQLKFDDNGNYELVEVYPDGMAN